MSTLPKHTNVTLKNIYGETINATLIPISIKGTMEIEALVEKMKTELTVNRDVKIEHYRKTLDYENKTDEELKDSYVQSKVTMDLSKLSEDITDERIESLKKKRFDKLIEGKTRENMINELSDILYDLEIRKLILNSTVSMTLWNILRKTDNLRERVFDTIDDLNESIDLETLVNIFKNTEEAKASEEDLKN